MPQPCRSQLCQDSATLLSIVELKSLLSRALGHNCVGYCDVDQAPNRDDVLCYLMMGDFVVGGYSGRYD